MLIVADSSALVALAAADALWLLDELFSEIRGIEVVGSLGALLRAKEAGLISEVRPLLAAMQAAGIRYSEQLFAEALRLAGE